jgi:hypothetical protein
MISTASRQISWWSVHEFVTPKLETVGIWPLLGTPTWCQLDDRDPVKWAAVLDAGQHAALRWETRQQLLADAAKEIATGGENWSRVASEMHTLEEFHRTRPWMKRRTS